MKNKTNTGLRRVLVTLICYLSVILSALVLGMTNQFADWVAQVAIALSLFRLVFLFGWGASKNNWRWKV